MKDLLIFLWREWRAQTVKSRIVFALCVCVFVVCTGRALHIVVPKVIAEARRVASEPPEQKCNCNCPCSQACR